MLSAGHSRRAELGVGRSRVPWALLFYPNKQTELPEMLSRL